MSWLSEKTGRPKEEGGHERVNLTLSKLTLEVLEKLKVKYGDDVNKSQLIEECIKLTHDLLDVEDNEEFQTSLLDFILGMLKKFGEA